MAMQARQQQQEVEVEDETFGPMPLNRLEVFVAVEFPIVTFELLLSLLIFTFITFIKSTCTMMYSSFEIEKLP